MRRFSLAKVLVTLVAILAFVPLPVAAAEPAGRRLEVLFLGDQDHHDPVSRYRVIKQALGRRGVNFTYQEGAGVLTRENLARFDTILLYANLRELPAERERDLFEYIEGGGGFAPIHCASACFGHSRSFINLVGARFKSHGTGVFAATITDNGHPVTRDLQPFEVWDETYTHDLHNEEQRRVLMKREDEPWTWVRPQGKGRVFYTAHGHDERCWTNAEFQELVYRGLVWSAGDAAAAALKALDLPALEFEPQPIGNYQTKEPLTPVQKPLPPEQSLKLAQVPIGLQARLFAAEPLVYNPLAIAWDERGRAFVAVTDDYPHDLKPAGTGGDKVLMFHDDNGDGTADRSTVFADKLSIPTALIAANGGLLCVDSDTIVHLRDGDGDGVADQRKTIITGIGTNDTHAGTSNFTYGFDNWIYATSGYAGFRGTVGGKEHAFRMGVYRFRPDGSELEFLQATTNNTWGLGVLETGEIMGSTANGNPSWYHTLPDRLVTQAGIEAGRTPRADTSWLAYPITSDVRQVDFYLGYSAAAGHRLYTSRLLPETFWNRAAFICEPTAHLVSAPVVSRAGAGFQTEMRAPLHLYASADAWSSPVAAEVGPDGAVWLLDWYHSIVQHNPTPNRKSAGIDAETGPRGAYKTPFRHTRYGRVYRILPENGATEPAPALDSSKPATLVAALSHPNLLWRLHAQRLLVERGNSDVWPELVDLARHAPADALGSRPAAIHALGALDGLGAFRMDSPWASGLLAALAADPAPAVRRFALRYAPKSPAMARAILSSTTAERDPGILVEILRLAAEVPSDEPTGNALWQFARHHPLLTVKPEPDLATAITIAATRHATGFLLAAMEKSPPGIAYGPTWLLTDIAAKVPAGGSRNAVAAAVAATSHPMAKDLTEALARVPEPAGDVPRRFSIDPKIHEAGAKVYAATCIACHQPDGKGLAPEFPPLDGSPYVNGKSSRLARIVQAGITGEIKVLGKTYNGAMPGHPTFSDQEMADVLTYVRQSWSNDASPVNAAEIKAVRDAMTGRATSYTAAELDAME